MAATAQDSHLTLPIVECMFEYLDKLEEKLPNTPDKNSLRANLGLPSYRFSDAHEASFFPTCGAPVKFVFPSEMRAEATKTASPEQYRPATTQNNPEECLRRGLCAPHGVRQRFRLCGQDVVGARNFLPYGRNHGVVR